MGQIVLHLDMNSYFASVEQQANDLLRGKPVGVCEHLGGIIIAPSVEAKRLGIKLGTSVWFAKKIYPKIILLPTDPPKYREVTKRFLKILSDYSNQLEQYSIDEAFIDVTQIIKEDYDQALLLGLEIKYRIRREIGEWISCSIGIGPNRLIAKIAADLGNGDIDRIAVVEPETISQLYQRLSLVDVPGIGMRLALKLNKLGIFNLRQLAEYPLENLLNQFGINGYCLNQMANFNYDPGALIPARDHVQGDSWTEENPKSFGHAYTVPHELTKMSDVKVLLYKLSEKVGRRMRMVKARGNIVYIFASSKRHIGFSRQRKIGEYISSGSDIYKLALEIFLESHSNPVSVKIMGVTVAGIIFGDEPISLFWQRKKISLVDEAMDQINDKYGEWSIKRGRLLAGTDWARDTIGFG